MQKDQNSSATEEQDHASRNQTGSSLDQSSSSGNHTISAQDETRKRELELNESVKHFSHGLQRVVEFVMAIVVIVAVAIEITHLFPMLRDLTASGAGSGAYEEFLSFVLDIVIGVEFFRLLAAPDLKVVLEVMMFAMTRHMIVESTTAMENLLTIIGIGIIAYLQRYLREKKRSRTLLQAIRDRRARIRRRGARTDADSLGQTTKKNQSEPESEPEEENGRPLV
jgi:uncharacterized membrane protein (DUF373 family)